MTENEKAKAYDEALEKARAINNGKDVDVESGTTICEYIFPELKESEDDTNLIKCCGAYYKHCIPYNEETQHLVGTTDEAPDFYKFWED